MRLILDSDEKFISECVDRVTVPDVIYTNGRPRPNGLLCERIFGCYNNYRCSCGKLDGIVWRGRTCTKCNVIVEKSTRDKYSYIDLEFYSLNHLLVKKLSKHFFKNISLSKHITEFPKFNVMITEKETKFKIYTDLLDSYNIKYDKFRSILDESGNSFVFVKYTTEDSNDSNILNIGYFYESINLFLNILIDKEWYMEKEDKKIIHMINYDFSNLTTKIVRVLPAKYRDIEIIDKMIKIDSINEVYKSILNIDLRIKKMVSVINGMDPVNEKDDIDTIKNIINYEFSTLIGITYKLYFESIFIQNMKCNTYKKILHGKRGLIRGDLLGRRVSFSGRTVIVGDSLDGLNVKDDSIMVPFIVAKNLIRYHLYKFMSKKRKLYYKEYENLAKENAEEYIEAMKEYIRTIKPIVVIGRQPTLYKHSMIAFYMEINFKDLEDKTLKLNPLWNGLLNADYDGDTCYLSLVVSKQGYKDAKERMFLSRNMFLDKNNNPAYNFSIEYIYGLWYISNKEYGKKVDMWENSSTYLCDYDDSGETFGYQRMRRIFIDNNLNIESFILPNEVLTKKRITKLVNDLILSVPSKEIFLNILHELKNLSIRGFSESGLSISLKDLDVFKKDISQLDVNNDVKYQSQISSMTERHFESLDHNNSLKKIIKSGTKGDISQFQTLLVSKGVLLDCTGKKMKPIINSIGDGLTARDYIDSVKGSRKGLVDKSISTAISGYFTARITKSFRDYIIDTEDCGTDTGIQIPISNALNRTSIDKIDGIIEKDEVFTHEHIEKLIEKEGKDTYVNVRTPLFCNRKHDNKCCVKCYGHVNSTREKPGIGFNIGVNSATTLSEIITQMVLRNFHTSGSFKTNYEEIYSKSNIDKLDIVEYTDYLIIKLDNKEYLVHKKECIILKNENIKEGDLVFKYPTSNDDISNAYDKLNAIVEGLSVKNKSTICKESGLLVMKSFNDSITYKNPKTKLSKLKIPHKNNTITLSIKDSNGVELDSYDVDLNKCQLKVPLNSMVNKGDIITTGNTDYNTLYKIIGEEVYLIMLDDIDMLYKSVGVSLDFKHIEILISHIFRNSRIKGVTNLTKDKSFINHLSIGYFYDAVLNSITKYNQLDGDDSASRIAMNNY